MAEVYILETFHLGISISAKGTVKMYVCWYTLFTVFQLQQDIESMATLDLFPNNNGDSCCSYLFKFRHVAQKHNNKYKVYL